MFVPDWVPSFIILVYVFWIFISTFCVYFIFYRMCYLYFSKLETVWRLLMSLRSAKTFRTPNWVVCFCTPGCYYIHTSYFIRVRRSSYFYQQSAGPFHNDNGRGRSLTVVTCDSRYSCRQINLKQKRGGGRSCGKWQGTG